MSCISMKRSHFITIPTALSIKRSADSCICLSHADNVSRRKSLLDHSGEVSAIGRVFFIYSNPSIHVARVNGDDSVCEVNSMTIDDLLLSLSDQSFGLVGCCRMLRRPSP